MESDADSWYGVRAKEARQLAWLTAQFYDALVVCKVPEALVHDLVCSWFCEELAVGGDEPADDDD